MKKIKLSKWAKDNGLCYMTAWRLVNTNQFPLPVEILSTGTILVEMPEEKQDQKYVIYTRVSSSDQKDDLERQLARLRDFCSSKGISISDEISEIGSGLNGHRVKLTKLLSSDVNLVVEHKDRLCRFGFEYLCAALSAQNRKIVVMNETESKLDIVQDFVDVVTSMCTRIYGKRSAKNKALRAIKETERDG